MPQARVVATLTGTGQHREGATNEAGEYVLPQLPPGAYRITVQAKGFQTAVVEAWPLSIAERSTVNVSLKLGQVTEQMEVTATVPLLEQETASLGQTITRRTINDLPLDGRNYISLGALSPGVIPEISVGPASFIGATTGRSDRSILVGGQRESSTSYLFDGVEMRNPRLGDTSITPSLDAIEEFKIQRTFFQAEFGNSPSIINVASRGGSNGFHGSAFNFLRNDAMDARNFFSDGVEPFRRNQFGGSIAGPVKKDKIFFFANFENVRQRLSSIQRAIYPTQNELSGDLSGLNTTVYDPLTFNAATQSRTPFAGNQIPAVRINQVSKNFFPYIPVTNSPVIDGANVSGTPKQVLDDDQLNLRGDWVINSKNSLFGRYSREKSPIEPATLAPLAGSLIDTKGISSVAQLTTTLSPSIVNVARASYAYMMLFGRQAKVNEDLAKKLGITGVSNAPLNWGLPGVYIDGYDSIGSNTLTQGNVLNNYELADDLTWIRASHTIKMGYAVRQSRFMLDSDNEARGAFSFSPSYTAALDSVTGAPLSDTGSGLADFLLGYPTNMSGAVGTSATHFQFYTHNLFIQDDWKVTHELTLNFGLRWEYMGPPTPIKQEWDHVYGFDFNTGKQLFPTLGQIRPSIVKPDYKDFAPRLGFAYNPKFSPLFVVRGGIGIYYDQSQMNETQFITNGPPIYAQQSFNMTGSGLPQYQFGVNALPVITVPPVNSSYVMPQGTNLFAEEIDGRKPREYMWDVSAQRSFWKNWVLEAAYVGAHGRRLSKRYNAYANATPGVLYDVTPGVATKYPRMGQMLYSSQAGWSDFNGLNLRLERSFKNGVQLLMAETWSKSIDTDSAGAYGSPNLNPANFQLDKGPSDFDIRHRWVTSAVYELPFGKGKPWLSHMNGLGNTALAGWQLNTIATWQTGTQHSVSADNLTGIAYISPRADATGIGVQSAYNGINPGKDFSGANTDRYWFNPNAFSQPGALKFGTSGRQIITSPSMLNFDLSAFKNFMLFENVPLQFRAEAFNVFNHTNFGPPDMYVQSPNFGTIQSTYGSRVMQLGLRLTF